MKTAEYALEQGKEKVSSIKKIGPVRKFFVKKFGLQRVKSINFKKHKNMLIAYCLWCGIL